MKRGCKQKKFCRICSTKNYSLKVSKWKKHAEDVIKRKFHGQKENYLRNLEKKGINININKDFPKETLGIRNGKWKTVKNLRKKVHTLS